MEESTKNSIKSVAVIFTSLIAFALFAIYVPDDATIKIVVGVLMMIVLALSIVFFTPLGNPIKKWYRKIKGIKE